MTGSLAGVGDDAGAAARIAREAGRLLVDLRRRCGELGLVPWEVGDEGDRRAHDLIVERLAEAFPGDAVLSEEGRDDRRRLEAERCWVVDPLAGTRAYGEGRDDGAVHVALVVDGTVAAAAVALPGLDLVLATDPAPPPPAVVRDVPLVLVSRSRPPMVSWAVRDALGGELYPMGSAGAKAMAVVRGEADVYVHAGGQYEWDNAAPAGVAAAAGLHVSRIDGSPLRYNQPDPWVPDLVVCRPELADRVLEAVNA